MASSNRDLTGFLQFDNNAASIVFLDKYHRSIAKQTRRCNTNDATQIQQYFPQLSSVVNLSQVKAILFGLVDVHFSSFSEAYNFRLECREFCQANGIFFCIEPLVSIVRFAGILHTKTMVNEGETIMITQYVGNGNIGATFLIREKNCYRYLFTTFPEVPQFTQEWKNKILGNKKPKKVIIFHHPLFSFVNHDPDRLKELFNNENSVIYYEDYEKGSFNDGIYDIALHRMGEKINPYINSTLYLNVLEVTSREDLLIKYVQQETLPFERSAVIPVDPAKTIKLISFLPTELIQEIKLSTFKCKKVKVTLIIDQNAFYDFKVDPIDDNDKLKESLSKMNIAGSLSAGKARIIFDKQNFTVLINANGKESVIQNEDDCNSTPIYIAFTGKKPLIGAGAKDIYNKKPKFVVFDLIKLCSIDNADVMNPKWCFKLEKEENESLMVTMDTVEGERRSSVDFLLALILKHGLQIIKNENGKKMNELEIGFNGFTANEMLKNNFEKAAALINLKIICV